MQESEARALLAKDGWQPYPDTGFTSLAGPYFVRETAGILHYCFVTEDKHHNSNGVVQGGALMTFADRALAATAKTSSGAARTATVQIDLQFIDAVKVGELVEAAPVVLRDTRHLVFMSTTLMVGSRAVAVATGIWKKLAEQSR